MSAAWTYPLMSNDPGRNEDACRDGLEPVDDQRRARRPSLDEPTGHRNGIDGQQRQWVNDPRHVLVTERPRGMPNRRTEPGNST